VVLISRSAVDESGNSLEAPAAATREGRRTRAVTLAGVALLAALLLVAAWREARQMSPNSDGASVALQAWDLLRGNLLLSGWRTADVSFYTTEMPVYVLVEAIRGLRSDVISIVAAINYTLLVAGAAVVAKGRVRGAEGLTRAAVAVAVMLLPSLTAAATLLEESDHAATAIWVLLALAVLQRSGRRWHGPALAGLIIAWASVGDPLVQVIGAAPLALTGLVWALRRSDRWYLWLVAAAAAGTAAAHLATALLTAAGGWQIVGSGEKFVASTALPGNLAVEAEDFLGLFSADFFGQRTGPALLPILVHLVAAAAVAAAIVIAARRLIRGPAAAPEGEPAAPGGDLIADVLVAAIACNLLAYLLLYPASPGQIREVSPVFGLGAALAGRMLGGPLIRARARPWLAAWTVAVLLAAGPALTGRAAPPQTEPLEGWLTAHHLTSGLAGYWQANGVILASAAGGNPAVEVRPVKGNNGRPVPYRWETYLPAYSPVTNRADFLVLTTGLLGPQPAVTEAGAAREFGAPAHVYRFRQYTILTWNRNILRRLP